jgi:hypothetical protein
MAMPPPVSKLDIEEAERLPDRLLRQPHDCEGGADGLWKKIRLPLVW